jgi:cytochrome c-type biogenesis protein CcmH
MRRRLFVLVSSVVLAVAASVALAVEPDEVLTDPALEARARALSKTLRCMVCQNQSIDDSNAPLARDLRVLVRERVKAGDTDRQVQDFLVARYGEFVLLEPRLAPRTLLLWSVPALVLALGLGAILWALRRRPRLRPTPLSEDEKRRLSSITKGSSDLTNL